jgi:hypothetical protein
LVGKPARAGKEEQQQQADEGSGAGHCAQSTPW